MSIDLFLDTETTGFTTSQPYDHESQPDCVQLAAQLYDNRKLISEFSFILMNSTSPIQPKAAEIHGITPELVTAHGVNPRLPLTCLAQMYSKAERVFAFNMAFDWAILRTASHRSGVKLEHNSLYCTMMSVHGHVPKEDGSKRFPKLMESFKHFVDPLGFDGAHDAMADVRALARVTFAAEDRGITMIPPKGF